MTSYNTGTTANSGNTQLVNQPITIPAGVQAGEIVLVAVAHVSLTAAVSTLTASSTGTTPVIAGPQKNIINASAPATLNTAVFKFVAGAADAGKVITFSATTTGFWSISLVSYPGTAGLTAIDVIDGVPSAVGASSVTAPALTTGVNGDWQIQIAVGAFENGSATVSFSGGVQRQSIMSSASMLSAIWDSNGSVGNAGTAIGGAVFTAGNNIANLLAAYTIGLSRAPVFSAAFQSTDGNGVQTWNVTSSNNNSGNPGPMPMRVLPPSSPNNAYPHAFLFMLPVEPGQGTTFGDSIATALALNAHNNYNLTIIQPGFAISPWYADNPNDPATQQETFVLDAVAWAAANFATTGIEKNYLIGFSKSGIGGQGLQYRHPTIFAATASWDAPFGMTGYDGTDPNGVVGGGSAAVYGTAANFSNNYALSSANLGGWNAPFIAAKRLWIGGYFSFQNDVSGYDALLTALGVKHTYIQSLNASHAWHTDWVASALAAMIPAKTSTGLIMASFP